MVIAKVKGKPGCVKRKCHNVKVGQSHPENENGKHGNPPHPLQGYSN